MAALASPSLIPSSLCFSAAADGPRRSLSSCFSAFSDGGTNLRSHKNFLSPVSSPSSPNRNRRRGFSRPSLLVFASSGDYYATLGVPKSANNKEIKAAYRRLARQVHPPILFLHFPIPASFGNLETGSFIFILLNFWVCTL